MSREATLRKRRVNLMMDPEVLAKVREIADYEDRSISAQVNRMMREWLENEGLLHTEPGA
jgi:hypothetical protein